MNETKTKVRRFTPPGNGKKPDTFQFSGFMHYWGKSRKGNWVVKRQTDKSRLTRMLKAVSAWCRKHRHDSIREQNYMLNLKLNGHYNYYGITPNSKSIRFFFRKRKKNLDEMAQPKITESASQLDYVQPSPSKIPLSCTYNLSLLCLKRNFDV